MVAPVWAARVPAGVAEIVQMNVVEVGQPAGPIPGGIEGGPAQTFRQRPGEDQGVGLGRAVLVHMGDQEGCNRRRQVDGALPGRCLGVRLDALAVLQLDGLAVHPEFRLFAVDIGAAQGQELAEAQAAEAGQEHQRPVAVLDVLGQGQDDLCVDERPLGCPLDPGASDAAGVLGDTLVLDGGVEDDPQQPVGLGRLRCPGVGRRWRYASGGRPRCAAS